MKWIALCDADGPFGETAVRPVAASDLIERGSLVLEVTLSATDSPGQILLAFNRMHLWHRHLSLTLLPCGTIALRQRQARATAELHLALPLSDSQRDLRLTYIWDAPRRISRLTAENLTDGTSHHADGTNPIPLPADDVAALHDRSLTTRHPRLLWFGVTRGIEHTGLHGACTGSTPVATPYGPRRIDTLAPGDLVLTADSGPQPVRCLARFDVPARGAYTPIRLRAPYFGNHSDLIVAPLQRIALRGAEVEYLFGEDEVLVEARRLVNGRSAVFERHRALARYYAVLLDSHALIDTDGCLQESLSAGQFAATSGHWPASPLASLAAALHPAHRHPARPELRGYEAATLQAMRDQMGNPAAA